MEQKPTLGHVEYGMKILEFSQKKLEELEDTVKNTKKPLIEELQVPEPTVPKPTHQDLENVLHEVAGIIAKAGGIIAGGFVSAYVKWDTLRAPADCDIWLPVNCHIWEIPGWTTTKRYDVYTTKNMSPDVTHITEYKKDGCPITLQVLNTRLEDVYDVVNRFDFDVSRGIISPAILEDGSMVGIRATKPEILQMIRENKTTYTEHYWDVNEEGKLNNKALNRFRRYIAKGYDIVPSASSRYTSEQITDMLQEQPKTEQKGKASYYEDDGIIPHNSLAYVGGMIPRLYGVLHLSRSSENIAFSKLLRDFWQSNCNILPDILKPGWMLKEDIISSSKQKMIRRMYS
jgi:hypothetical protein